jgi:phosphate transport system substrate-binding protein
MSRRSLDKESRVRAALRRTGAVLVLILAALGVIGVGPASAGSLVNGAGSTYVYIAVRQWIAEGQSNGLQVNYTPQGSPTGLNLYAQSRIDFAGTEAEYASLPAPNPPRGHQYVPDVAGATAIMYNIKDGAGRTVDYLHLDTATVARIFTGTIRRWSDPAISRTNKNIKFPDQPIRVVLRGNPSGTTALFYDFIRSTLGGEYDRWYTGFQCGDPKVRPVVITCQKAGYIPNFVQFNDSEQIAQYVASSNGQWSIGFDEFGYAKKFHTSTAWIRNVSGSYVQPYAQNISAALESARLRADLSQDLSGVYTSRNKAAYPISAYSYLVTPCAPAGDRPTCKGAYTDAGQVDTMAKWMRDIACDGQVNMANLGYSPLPPNLSQEMANSIGRLTGKAPERLSSSNCSNPRFRGSLGAGSTSPCDPFLCGGNTGGNNGTGGSTGGGTRNGGSTGGGTRNGGSTGGGTGARGTTGGTGAVVTAAGGAPVAAVGGGSDAASWRSASPVSLNAPVPDDPFGSLPAVLVFAAVPLPALIGMAARRPRRDRAD